eukprot:3538768-Rhodomonas_salina.1
MMMPPTATSLPRAPPPPAEAVTRTATLSSRRGGAAQSRGVLLTLRVGRTARSSRCWYASAFDRAFGVCYVPAVRCAVLSERVALRCASASGSARCSACGSSSASVNARSARGYAAVYGSSAAFYGCNTAVFDCNASVYGSGASVFGCNAFLQC